LLLRVQQMDICKFLYFLSISVTKIKLWLQECSIWKTIICSSVTFCKDKSSENKTPSGSNYILWMGYNETGVYTQSASGYYTSSNFIYPQKEFRATLHPPPYCFQLSEERLDEYWGVRWMGGSCQCWNLCQKKKMLLVLGGHCSHTQPCCNWTCMNIWTVLLLSLTALIKCSLLILQSSDPLTHNIHGFFYHGKIYSTAWTMNDERMYHIIGMQFQRAATLKLWWTDLRRVNYSLLIIMCL
jgi:hypothetical protein